jgi:hypothetical protein
MARIVAMRAIVIADRERRSARAIGGQTNQVSDRWRRSPRALAAARWPRDSVR